MLVRFLGMLYAVVCYCAGMGVLLYSAAWLIDIGVPTGLDSPGTQAFGPALMVNLGLLVLFSVQHSVMARPGFKAAWTRWVPVHLERATYVLFSAVAMLGMMWFWQPLGINIWALTGAAQIAMYVAFAMGWTVLVVSTFWLNHFELFGLRQAWLHLRGLRYRSIPFATPGLYQWVRHPIYVGWLLAIWAAPTMTVSHLVFAVATTIYILGAIRLEEKDLADVLPEYQAYQHRVPALIPGKLRDELADSRAPS